jgi:phospholipid/cholesterol/gamma-HCH transport system permease protein
VHYLFVPRVIAGILMLPFLVILGDALGIYGGYLVSVKLLGANPLVYEQNTFNFLELNDLWSGLIKSSVFGLILTLTGCVRGYYTTGGAEGVGKATTNAVVSASLIILLSDFFLTKVLF